MRFLRRLQWMRRNWRHRWIAVADQGVFVFEVGDEVRGVHIDGPDAEAMRAELDNLYDGRRWESQTGRWLH